MKLGYAVGDATIPSVHEAQRMQVSAGVLKILGGSWMLAAYS